MQWPLRNDKFSWRIMSGNVVRIYVIGTFIIVHRLEFEAWMIIWQNICETIFRSVTWKISECTWLIATNVFQFLKFLTEPTNFIVCWVTSVKKLINCLSFISFSIEFIFSEWKKPKKKLIMCFKCEWLLTWSRSPLTWDDNVQQNSLLILVDLYPLRYLVKRDYHCSLHPQLFRIVDVW